MMRFQNPILLWFSQLQIRLFTFFFGKKVGEDQFGNIYYTEKRPRNPRYHRRWVLFKGEPEASRVPPEWYGWLHHMSEKPLSKNSPYHQKWVKPHCENQTGTSKAYFPAGHLYSSKEAFHPSAEYKPWRPPQ